MTKTSPFPQKAWVCAQYHPNILILKKRNMANMSYCRFENTTKDMEDCIYAIENGETDELSSYEVNALEDFVQIAKNILNLEDEINDIINQYRNGN